MLRIRTFPDVGTWIVGENGTILHLDQAQGPTTGSGLTSWMFPPSFFLWQNYPILSTLPRPYAMPYRIEAM